MAYISKELAMQYLMGNMMIFYKVRDSFLLSYEDYEVKFNQLLQNKDFKGLEMYIHSIKGISLNLGAQMLYDSSVDALVGIRKELWEEDVLNHFLTVLDNSYKELQTL